MRFVKLAMLSPGDEPVLAGKLNGKRAFARFVHMLAEFTAPPVVVLDFAGVDLATSSFLNEAVLRFRDHLHLSAPAGYLAVANLSEKVAEELDDLLQRAGDALLAARVSDGDSISETRLLGKLEPKLQETFDLVVRKGETTAVELHNGGEADGIGPTAWNNRLNALAAKSLLIEIPAGRAKRYRPVLETA
jgi:hypothetical protein